MSIKKIAIGIVAVVVLVGGAISIRLASDHKDPGQTTTTPSIGSSLEPSSTDAGSSVSSETSSVNPTTASTTTTASTSTTSSSSETTTSSTSTSSESKSTSATESVSTTSNTTAATTQSQTAGGSGFYENIQETDISVGVLVLVNKNYKLPESFEPSDLEEIPANYSVRADREYYMQKEALDAFIEMSDAAYAEDKEIDLRVISGYRSHSYQKWLYNNYSENYGQEEADTYSARPGHSEHETGLACDINIVDQSFENTKAFAWLQEHAHEYGYILRFPKGKEHITGYIYEPWHWRYIGVEYAEAVKNSGLTYEEYYLKYLSN